MLINLKCDDVLKMSRDLQSTYIVKIKRNKKNVRKPTLYPKIPLRDDDIYIFSRESDKLEHLSYRFYGNSEFWWVIARANNISNGSIFLEPGKQLRIPIITV